MKREFVVAASIFPSSPKTIFSALEHPLYAFGAALLHHNQEDPNAIAFGTRNTITKGTGHWAVDTTILHKYGNRGCRWQPRLTEGATARSVSAQLQQQQLQQQSPAGSVIRITFVRGSKRQREHPHPFSTERLPAAASAATPSTAQHIQITSC